MLSGGGRELSCGLCGNVIRLHVPLDDDPEAGLDIAEAAIAGG